MSFPLIHVLLWLVLVSDVPWLYWTVFLVGTGLVIAATLRAARTDEAADDGRCFGTAVIGFLLTFLWSASPHWFGNARWTLLELAIVTGIPLAVAVLLWLKQAEGPLGTPELAVAAAGGIGGTFLAFYLLFRLQSLASPFVPLESLSTIDILGLGAGKDASTTGWLRCMQAAQCSEWKRTEMLPRGSFEPSRLYWELQFFIAIVWDTLLILAGVLVTTALGRIVLIRSDGAAERST